MVFGGKIKIIKQTKTKQKKTKKGPKKPLCIFFVLSEFYTFLCRYIYEAPSIQYSLVFSSV